MIIVDDSDKVILEAFSWRVFDRYAETSINGKTVRLHRLIMGVDDSRHVDHINGNTLDNRRDNLRVCNRFENQQNRKINKNSKTGHKGIQKLPSGNYRARVQAFGQRHHIGVFDSLELAIKARNEKAKELHNEFYRER